jgi:hypothetical protein
MEQRRADAVLDAVLEAGQLDESLGSGIVLQLGVERALGMSEHVAALSKASPVSEGPDA